MLPDPAVTDLIPHRPPFLWVDTILSCSPDKIETQKTVPEDLDVFQGHYPHHPILPGVLLCEALFQSGALLIAKTLKNNDEGIPVLTRIGGARFKRQVGPGDCLDMQVVLKEKISTAWFLKGTLRVNGKVAVQVDFTCTMAPDDSL